MKMNFKLSGLLLLSIVLFAACRDNYRLYVGSYTEKDGDKGFSVFDFNARSGKLKPLSASEAGPNPSFFCYSGKNHLFYAINEVMEFNGVKGGGLTTLRYDGKNGIPETVNQMVIPNGGPCFISMSHDSSYLFIANYPKGCLAVVRLDREGIPQSVTDTIIFNKDNPEESHAHMIINDPSGSHVYMSDLGMNMIRIFDFDTLAGRLNLIKDGIVKVSGGSGPRHFTFNSDGSMLYLINELGSTVMAFSVLPDGSLELMQTLTTLKYGFKGENACAEISLGKDGKYLYGSNRGENSIITFSVEKDGMLKLAGSTTCGGNWPRNFVIDPSGRFMLVGNERSDNIAVFRIDPDTGLPSRLVDNIKVMKPVCLEILRVN